MSFTSKLEQGAMMSVPVYESHRRGRNWMAVIQKDPKSPGGLARTFMEQARGEYFYLINGVKVGDPVEFGADYYSGSGKRSSTRWYGVVVALTDEEIVLEEYPTAATAIEASQKYEGRRIEALREEKKRLEARLKEIEEELMLLEKEEMKNGR